MTNILRRLFVIAMALCPTGGAAQTWQFLDAPEVRSRIGVQWDAAEKVMKYADDDQDTFVELPADFLFLTRTSVYVTYPRINPLVVQATASVSTADDPAHATIATLLDAMSNVVSIVNPTVPALSAQLAAPGTVCAEPLTAQQMIAALDLALFGPARAPTTVQKSVRELATAIRDGYRAGQSGPAAISAAVKLIDTFIATVNAAATAADPLKKLEAQASLTAAPATECDAIASALYHVTHLGNPCARLEQLETFTSAARQLRDTLVKDDVDAETLSPTDYAISKEIKPSPEKLRNAVVKTVNIGVVVDDVTSALVVKREEAGSVAFSVEYSVLAPELGAGVVVGFVPRPKYGTAKNAASETVVAPVPDDSFLSAPVSWCTSSAGATSGRS